MTNWERIKQVIKIDKDFLLRYYGITKDDKGNDIICLCSSMICADCIFYKCDECTRVMADYLEKEVSENERYYIP